jgi:hypothetical protein
MFTYYGGNAHTLRCFVCMHARVCASLYVCVYMHTYIHTFTTTVHYKNAQNNGIMAPGHVFTIEPMINEGGHNVSIENIIYIYIYMREHYICVHDQ